MFQALTTPLPPYAYTLIGLGIVLFFTIRGYRRGVIREGFSILSLVFSALLAKPVGALLITLGFLSLENIPVFLHSLAAGGVGGIVAYVVLRLSLFVIGKVFKLYRKREGRAKVIVKAGGAILGGLFGIVLVFILAWYVLLFGKITPTPRNEAEAESLLMLPAKMLSTHKQGLEQSTLGSIAENTSPVPDEIETSVEIFSEVSQNPEKLVELLEYEPITQMLEQESVLQLMGNQEIREMAEEGDFMGILNHPDVQSVMEDPDIQELMKSIDPEEVKALLRQAADDQ